jgi:hypothetical protein
MSTVTAKNDASNEVTIILDGDHGNISAGGHGQDGDIVLYDKKALRIQLGAVNGNLLFRDPPAVGALMGALRVQLSGEGNLLLNGDGGQNRIRLDGANADAWLGGNGAQGAVMLFASGGDNKSVSKATVVLDGSNGNIRVSSPGGQQSIRIDGEQANFWIGGNGMDGDVVIFPSTVSNDAVKEMASIYISGDGSVISIRSGGQETIRIDGKQGDIILANADGAEEFEVDDDSTEPGSVLVITDATRLRLTDRPYDRRVAGIVSGAAGIRPGIVLGRGREGVCVPLALFGRVNCKVDASYGSIIAGDLLTTSETLGHAMRAEPGNRALGAVIGKALGARDSGRGLVPVLVALQ